MNHDKEPMMLSLKEKIIYSFTFVILHPIIIVNVSITSAYVRRVEHPILKHFTYTYADFCTARQRINNYDLTSSFNSKKNNNLVH